MIRKAELKDLAYISELEEKILGHTMGYAFLKQELLENPFSRIYVYEKDGRVIGYIGYRVVDQRADILNFLIDIEYQNQGFGSKLFENMLTELKNEGVVSVILEVRESNLRAVKFYEKYGGYHVHKISNYYLTEDAHIMMLEVDA